MTEVCQLFLIRILLLLFITIIVVWIRSTTAVQSGRHNNKPVVRSARVRAPPKDNVIARASS